MKQMSKHLKKNQVKKKKAFIYIYLLLPKTASLVLNLRSIEVGRNARMNLLEDIVCDRPLLCFFFEVVPTSFTDLEDFESKIDELNDESSPPLKETGPLLLLLWDGSSGCPTAASRCGGGNFSLLLFAFPCVTTLHL